MTTFTTARSAETTTFGYDALGRIRIRLIGTGVFAAMALACCTQARASGAVTYSYDALGRLIEASTASTTNDDSLVATTYYDRAGNRANVAVTVGATGGTGGVANLAIGNASATEGGSLAFTVTRSGNIATAVSANYATASGTATSGTDFTAASGTLSFTANEISKTIAVASINDALVENNESFPVTLSGASINATIVTAVGTGTIIDNDSGWSSTIAAGHSQSGSNDIYGYIENSIGSMSNYTWNYSGINFTISVLSSTVNSLGGGILLIIKGGIPHPNAGWTTITIPGIGIKTRASANYSYSGNQAIWSWSNTERAAAISGQVLIQ